MSELNPNCPAKLRHSSCENIARISILIRNVTPRPSLANPLWPLYLSVLLWPHPTPFERRGQIFSKMLMARCLKMMLPWLPRVWRQQSISQNRWRNRQQANTHLGSSATHSEQQEIRPWSINWSWRQNSCVLLFLCLLVKIVTEIFHWNC